MDGLEVLIRTGREILRDKLDIDMPNNIKVETVSSNQCTYEPKYRIVKVPENVSKGRFIHEYFGHGLFDAYSDVGKELRTLEAEIDAFESRYSIPKDATIMVEPVNGDTRIEINPGYGKNEVKNLVKDFSRALERSLFEYRNAASFTNSVKSTIESNDFEVDEDVLGEMTQLAKSFVSTKDESLLKCIEGLFDKIIKQKNGGVEYQYILYCDTNDEVVSRYLNLKTEYKALFEETRSLQEGFALWMEYFVLGEMNEKRELEKRSHEIEGTNYGACFKEFSDRIMEDGLFSTFYSLGFPHSLRNDLVLCYVKEKFDSLEGLQLLLFYGSGKRDIDLLAVFDDETISERELLYDGTLDLHILNMGEFLNGLNHFDIELLEPVRQGRLLFGDEDAFGLLNEEIENQRPTDLVVDYNKRKVFENLANAEFFLDQHKYNAKATKSWEVDSNDLIEIVDEKGDFESSKDLTRALNALGYCLSYLSSWKSYSSSGKILSHRDMLEADSLHENVTQYLKDVENGLSFPDRSIVETFFGLVKKRISFETEERQLSLW